MFFQENSEKEINNFLNNIVSSSGGVKGGQRSGPPPGAKYNSLKINTSAVKINKILPFY